jgi:polyisoprenoid-binding protein YceI
LLNYTVINTKVNKKDYICIKLKLIKMKKNVILVLAVAAVALVSWKGVETFNSNDSKAYKLDTAATTLAWTGKYVSDGHTHTGTVNVVNGDLTVTGNNVSGTFNVDMKTIICKDLEGDKNGYLVGHLNSPDFFNTEKFSNVKVTVNGMTDKEIMVSINVLGKDIKSTIPVEVSKSANSMLVKGKIEIDFASLDLNGFKAGAGKPENQRTDSKIAFDLSLALKS